MQDSNMLFVTIAPYFLTLLLVAWSLFRKEKWVVPALVSVCFASGAFIFYFVKEEATRYGHFNIGFTAGMYVSVVATVPLAGFGWYIGKKLKQKMAFVVALAAIILNLLVAYLYEYTLKRTADELKKEEVVFDCAKVPYHCAIRDHRLAEIPLLKKQGKDIEAHDALSRTALWYGIDNAEAVRVLLENGANPDSFNLRSETPLAYVLVMAMKPNIPVARLLVKYGAKVNRTFGYRKKVTIVNFAIINKQTDVVNFLLENGADPTFVDDYHKSGCERLKKWSNSGVHNVEKYCP